MTAPPPAKKQRTTIAHKLAQTGDALSLALLALRDARPGRRRPRPGRPPPRAPGEVATGQSSPPAISPTRDKGAAEAHLSFGGPLTYTIDWKT